MSKEETAKLLATYAIEGMNSTLSVFAFVLRKTFTGFTTSTAVSIYSGRIAPAEQRSIEHAFGALLDCMNKIRLSMDGEKIEARAEDCARLIDRFYPEYFKQRVERERWAKRIKNPAHDALHSLNILARRYKEVTIRARLVEKEVSAYRPLEQAVDLLTTAFAKAIADGTRMKLTLEYRPLQRYNNIEHIHTLLAQLKQDIIVELEAAK